MTAQNTTPNWRSYTTTGNPVDIVPSPTVAKAIGQKVDAQNGQAEGLALDGTTTLSGLTVDRVLGRFSTLPVTDFGVVDDPDGQHVDDNTAAYQTALDACAGQHQLLHPTGLSVVLHNIQITKSDTILILDGSLTLAPNSNTNCLDIYAPGKTLERISITGRGVIDGNGSNQQGGQTAVAGGICANTLSHTGNTPDDPTTPTLIDSLLISGITIRNTFNWPISLGHISNSLVSGVTLLNGGNSPQFIWSADNCWFNDSVSAGHTDGGFVFYMGCRKCGASGNSVYGNHDGIGVYSDASSQPANDGIIISGNMVHDNRDNGIGITTMTDDAHTITQRNILVTGNTLTNNNTGGRNGGGSIGIVAAYGVRVSGNRVTQDGSTTTSGQPVYSLYVSDSCQNIVITDNSFENVGSQTNHGTAIYINKASGCSIQNNTIADSGGASGVTRVGIGGILGARCIMGGNIALTPLSGPLLSLQWPDDAVFLGQPDGNGGQRNNLSLLTQLTVGGEYTYNNQTLSQPVAASASDGLFSFQAVRGSTDALTGGRFVLQTKAGLYRQFVMSGDGALSSPIGTLLTGDRGANGLPLYAQRFTVRAGHGDFVAFPRAFATNDVSVFVAPSFDGTNMQLAGASTTSPPTQAGFTLGKYWVGGGGANVAPAGKVTILAIGEISP